MNNRKYQKRLRKIKGKNRVRNKVKVKDEKGKILKF